MHARRPALVLSLVAALLAALVLTLSPAAPAYAAEESDTYADGSASTKYLSSALVTSPEESSIAMYDVFLFQPAHGRITRDGYGVGAWIVVYVEPDPGYKIEMINVAGVDDPIVRFGGKKPNSMTVQFYMPANNVSISASIVKSDVGVGAGGESSFSDVAEGDWYAEAVAFVSERGLMTGYEGTDRFGPGDELGREQAAMVLWRALGAGAQAPDCGLADVSQADWYAQAVNWAVASGLLSGYGDGSGRFGVGEALTRDQFAAIIARAAGVDLEPAGTDALDGFSDGGEVAEWAAPALSWAVRAGILTGSDDGHGGLELRAGADITRAEMATMIMRAALADLL